MGKKIQRTARTVSAGRRRRVDILTDEIAPWWKKNYVTVGKREVATWKGALVLMFITGITVALAWSANSGYFEFSNAADNSTLYFDEVGVRGTPVTTKSVLSGGDFVLNATINPGTNQVSGAELHVAYDQTKFRLDSITPPANCSGGPTFATVLSAASINNTNGTASIILGVCTATPPAPVITTTTVATFAFHALATTTALPIAFNTSTTYATAIGEPGDVLTSKTGVNVTVTAPDVTAPTGGSITYSNTYVTSASVSLTAADGTDAGSGINTSSRIVQRRSTTLTSGTCGTYGSWAAITPTGTYPNFTDTTVTTGNCYQYQYLVSDNASTPNQATYTSTNAVKIDTAAPTGGSVTYTDGYFTAASVAITAGDGTDAVSGINTGSRIVQRHSATLTAGTCGTYGSWAAVTPTGTYPSFTDATVATGNCYQYRYLISDTAGTQATFTTANAAKVDTAAPTGGSVTYTDGYFTAASVAITTGDGSDAVSGINTSSRIVQRRSATLTTGTCGSYGSYTTITPTGTYPNFTDATVATGNCYQYRYHVSDAAGTQAIYTNINTAKVDTAAPTGGSIAVADGYTHSGVITANDGTDAASGINTASRIVQRRSATMTGGACGTYGSWAAVTPTGAYPSFTDAAVTTANCYQYRYLVSDMAGIQVTSTSTNTAKVTYGADVTLDGNVNLFDYNVLFQNFGATDCGNPADIVANCLVNLFDYNQLFNDFGKSV